MSTNILTPIKLGNITIKNRIVFPSICTHFCNDDGSLSADYREFVHSLAKGGIGLITLPGNPHGNASAGRLAISEDLHMSNWRDIADIVHEYDARLLCQLHPVTVYDEHDKPLKNPVDFSKNMLEWLVKMFALAAERCMKSGVDGVEIQGCHERYIADFLSKRSNFRNDEYGGSYTGRAKLSIDIIKAIKALCGFDYPVVFKISSDEMIDKGRKLDETIEIIKLLEEAGIDAVHVSIGMEASEHYKCAPMDIEDCFNVHSAEAIKKVVEVPVITVNRITNLDDANEIIENGKADMTAMGRAHLADPELVNKYMGINSKPIRKCIGCNQGCRIGQVGGRKRITCMQNPLLGKLASVRLPDPSISLINKKIIIVGSGPAGLQVACMLAEKGLKPLIYEKSTTPGGLINLAYKPPYKSNINFLIEYRLDLLKKLGIEVICNKTVDKDFILEEKPDILILATGSNPAIPPIVGIEKDDIYTGDEILEGAKISGKKIAVLGGGLIGCETAEYLASRGKKVEIFEMMEDVATELVSSRRYFMLERMKKYGIKIYLNVRVQELKLPEIIVSNKEGQEKTLCGYDGAVIATGRHSNDALEKSLVDIDKIIKVIKIGDANKPSVAIDAIRNATEAVESILNER